MSFLKEGGPGSGVSHRNTSAINMPMSEYISVGTRKGLINNADWDEYEVPLAMITKVAQKNYVRRKMNALKKTPDILRTKPIDLLWVRGDGYHVIDGHHRFLAAKALGLVTIPARVFTKCEKSMPDYVPPKPKEQQAPGFSDFKKAAESLARGDWTGCFKYLAEKDTESWLKKRVKNPKTVCHKLLKEEMDIKGLRPAKSAIRNLALAIDHAKHGEYKVAALVAKDAKKAIDKFIADLEAIAGQRIVWRVHGLESLRDVQEFKTVEALIRGVAAYGIKKRGVNTNHRQRAELQGQPVFDKLNGPMYDGSGVIRYETSAANDMYST